MKGISAHNLPKVLDIVAGTLIHPNDARANGTSRIVDTDNGFPLMGDGNRSHSWPKLASYLGQYPLRRLEPIAWVLFPKTRVRIVQRKRRRCLGFGLSLQGPRDRFGTMGRAIKAHEHRFVRHDASIE